MKKFNRKHNSGFSALATVVVVGAILVLGFGGYAIYQAQTEIGFENNNDIEVERDTDLETDNTDNTDDTGNVEADTGVRGVAMVGPTCPVQRDDEDCEDRPYQGSFRIDTEAGQFVKNIQTSSDGSFDVALSPGTYVISKSNGEERFPHFGSETFIVIAGEYTDLELSLDSGIR